MWVLLLLVVATLVGGLVLPPRFQCRLDLLSPVEGSVIEGEGSVDVKTHLWFGSQVDLKAAMGGTESALLSITVNALDGDGRHNTTSFVMVPAREMNRDVVFHGLRPGRHTLHIKLLNNVTMDAFCGIANSKEGINAGTAVFSRFEVRGGGVSPPAQKEFCRTKECNLGDPTTTYRNNLADTWAPFLSAGPADFGAYSGCDSVVWVVLSGHVRTLTQVRRGATDHHSPAPRPQQPLSHPTLSLSTTTRIWKI